MSRQKKTASVIELIDVIEDAEDKRVSEQCIRSFIHKVGIKQVRKGKYSIAEVLTAREEAKRAILARAKSDDEPNTMSAVRIKKTQLECELLSIKRDEALGKLVPVDEINEELSVIATVFNQAFEGYLSYITVNFSDESVISGAEKATNDMRKYINDKMNEYYVERDDAEQAQQSKNISD